MRIRSGLWVGLVAWALAGCGGTEDTAKTGRLQLHEGKNVAEAPTCTLEGPACAAGTQCMSFVLDGKREQRCLGAEVCTDWMRCSGGTQCVLMSSYPVQVACSGTCTGDDCDTAVSSPAP
ncbi:hypothetical protein [Melittangium boletus]|uniref:Lipoprotein n=1 Tax=Melittangium boletus DSM 14713 TaxID=1294270 RepID=A0A250IGW3_9BACT|nr:hypothetical protein [Melittangium boletus]ATB30397.1 hypothetical protein MEBOL_003858 [Melittangium boletus DSM 14713]